MISEKDYTVEKLGDEILVREYQITKKPIYFDEIFKRFSDRVYGKCITFFESSAIAEDCVQEIFMKVLIKIDNFKEQSKFSTWLYSITYNYCIDRVRKSKTNPLDFNEEPPQNVTEDNETIQEKLLLEMELDHLNTVLNLIPTRDKAVLLMKYLDDMSIKDIAQSINKTESAVKMQLKRAKTKCVIKHAELFNNENEKVE